jgi:hypothetical protein
MITTATVTCGPTLRARVKVLRPITENHTEIEVIEGRGGWNKPGKIFVVRNSIMSDISTEEQVVAPRPAPVAVIPKPIKTLVLVESPELVEARIELARLEQALVANFKAPGGGRGKQGLRRTDAQIRRGAEYARKVKAAQIHVDVLLNSTARAAKPVTPERLRGAVAVRTELGWHRVVRVNAKSVTVATPYSWTDRISMGRIVDVR